jgi:transcriptional regulator with GAF, ATPase, and Fis domain
MSQSIRNLSSGKPPVEPLPGIIGSGAAMQEVYRVTRQVARSRASVLLLGETGTGKELIAHAVHELSQRRNRPFVRVNCGALSESLLESELFGHVRGAFTGAIENRTGRFEAAHTGTIFLDEINSVSYKLQVKLLRVLQEQEFERVGDTRTVRVDCRIVAATNRDLLDEIEEGRFREDLYYRLNVVPIYLPPLRDRREDIPLLIEFFARKYADSIRLPLPSLPEETTAILQNYSWPGNVRELQNYVERAIVLCAGESLTPDLFPPHVRGLAPIRVARQKTRSIDSLCGELVTRGILEAGDSDGVLHEKIVSLVERELLAQVLKSCQGVQTKAAARLGINRNTLHKKIDDYGLEAEAS